jgi:hypothetical protein
MPAAAGAVGMNDAVHGAPTMTLLAVALVLSRHVRASAGWQRRSRVAWRATDAQAQPRALFGWAAAYAVITLAAGAVGMFGIAAGSISPFLFLLTLSALTLAVSLLFLIAAIVARIAAPPERDGRGGPPRMH